MPASGAGVRHILEMAWQGYAGELRPALRQAVAPQQGIAGRNLKASGAPSNQALRSWRPEERTIPRELGSTKW